MARTALTVQTVSRTGLNPSYTSANADGHSVASEGEKTFLHVKNASGGSINVTVQTPGTVDGLAISDLIVAVPASGERMIGPFPIGYYTTSLLVDFSSVTSVTVAALKVG